MHEEQISSMRRSTLPHRRAANAPVAVRLRAPQAARRGLRDEIRALQNRRKSFEALARASRDLRRRRENGTAHISRVIYAQPQNPQGVRT
jgi:hypothetical protein